jgi:DNA-binding Lrp family transcriptional regulator
LPETTVLTGKTLKILRLLFERAKISYSYVAEVDQSKLAEEFKLTRQALNLHLRKLRSQGLIRTGRGFVEITSRGLTTLGLSSNIALVFLKISPQRRSEAYKKIASLPVWQVFRVAGDMDLVFVAEASRLDEILQSIAQIEGIEKTHSFITLEALK